MGRRTIVLVIMTISLAMVGIATTMTSLNVIQQRQAFAAKNECAFGLQKCWCYNTSSIQLVSCTSNAQDCKLAQSTDPTATSKCYRGHP
jgi:hypothetical protein